MSTETMDQHDLISDSYFDLTR